MIVSLTPNPSVDRAITVDALTRGEVHRARDVRVDAGGKGLNIARAITAQGGESLAVLPVGGPEGRLLEDLLDAAGVPRRSVAVAGAARVNVTVVEPDGTTTKLNEPGPVLAEAEIDALVVATLEAAETAHWVVGCGSLPPGAPDDLYAALVARVHGKGRRVAIDTSGAPLVTAVAARPNLIKPNHEELAELVGHALPTVGDVLGAARELAADGIEVVAVSMGAHGALAVTGSDAVHARATVSRPISTVGAGDCMLAGLLHGLASDLPLESALAQGVAWGSAAVTLPGSRVPRPDDLRGIAVDLTSHPDLTQDLGQS